MTQTVDPIQQALEYMRHQGAKDVAALEALIERTGGDWARSLESMSEAQASYQPDGEWCAKEVIGHLLVTNRGINQQIVEMAGITSPIEQHEKIRAMGEQSADEEKLPIGELRQRIVGVFKETTKLAASLDESDKLDEKFPHPLFGPLNLKEWIAFHRIHAMDHIQQVDKIKADPAYPDR